MNQPIANLPMLHRLVWRLRTHPIGNQIDRSALLGMGSIACACWAAVSALLLIQEEPAHPLVWAVCALSGIPIVSSLLAPLAFPWMVRRRLGAEHPVVLAARDAQNTMHALRIEQVIGTDYPIFYAALCVLLAQATGAAPAPRRSDGQVEHWFSCYGSTMHFHKNAAALTRQPICTGIERTISGLMFLAMLRAHGLSGALMGSNLMILIPFDHVPSAHRTLQAHALLAAHQRT